MTRSMTLAIRPILLLVVAVVLAIVLAAQGTNVQTKTIGIVAMTPGEAADLAAAEEGLANAAKSLSGMQHQITQRALATFTAKNPGVTVSAGCSETRTGIIEAGQVAIRSVQMCPEAELK